MRKDVNLLEDTKRSSQAMVAYATMPETTVADNGGRPAYGVADGAGSVTASSSPAATRDGMPM